MSKQPLEAAVRRESDAAIIELKGEIDAFADEALNTAYDSAVESEPQKLVLDFNNVSYINSTGIAVIVGLLARARAAKRSIVAFGLTEHYQHIFEITRLVDFMDIQPDEESALENKASSL